MNLIRAMPYTLAAETYNDSLGLTFFRTQRIAFEKIACDFGLRFNSAVDLGCGTGLFACHLARRWGARVFGVDRSLPMLRVACRKCRDPRVRFFRQDIREFRIPHRVELATCNFDTLNHLTGYGDLPRVFRHTCDALVPGGYFFFDVVTPVLPRRFQFRRRFRIPRGDILQTVCWHPAHRLLNITVLHRESGRRPVIEQHCERVYDPSVLGRWLNEAGLIVRGVFDAVTLRMPLNCPNRVIVLAEKSV